MADQKNQHTVPQFYLKKFSSDGKSVKKCLVGNKQIIERAGIRNTAAKDYFYGSDLGMENALKLAEDQAATIIGEIERTGSLPNRGSDDYFALCHYVVEQDARSLQTGENHRQFLLQTMYSIARVEKETGKYPDLNPEDVLTDLKIKNTANVPIQTAAFPLLKMERLEPFLIVNKSGLPFITSDNPVVCYNSLLIDVPEYRFGWAFLGVEVFLPLSSTLLLCFIDPMAYQTGNLATTIPIVSKKQIRKFNQLFCINAYREIYIPGGVEEKELLAILPHLKDRGIVLPEMPPVEDGQFIQGLVSQCPRERIELPIFKPKYEIKKRLTGIVYHPDTPELEKMADWVLEESRAKAARDSSRATS